jgi:hypothetical protein
MKEFYKNIIPEVRVIYPKSGDRYTIILKFYTLQDLYYYHKEGFELIHWINSEKAILEKI